MCSFSVGNFSRKADKYNEQMYAAALFPSFSADASLKSVKKGSPNLSGTSCPIIAAIASFKFRFSIPFMGIKLVKCSGFLLS